MILNNYQDPFQIFTTPFFKSYYTILPLKYMKIRENL